MLPWSVSSKLARVCILGEDELAMRKFEEDIVRQMLGKEDCPFATAGRLVTHFVRCSPKNPGTEIETLAGERTKEIEPRMHGQASGESR